MLEADKAATDATKTGGASELEVGEKRFERHSGDRVVIRRPKVEYYPVRSQSHGESKIVRERHTHYDDLLTAPSYVLDPATLPAYGPLTFDDQYPIERLTWVGMLRASDYRDFELSVHGESY